MAVTAGSYPGGFRVFIEQVGRESCAPVCGPSGLQRGVFSQFGSRLCGMMTLDAGNRACAVDTVLAAVVADMIEGHLAELCVLSENNNVRYFRYILLRFMRQAAA